MPLRNSQASLWTSKARLVSPALFSALSSKLPQQLSKHRTLNGLSSPKFQSPSTIISPNMVGSVTAISHEPCTKCFYYYDIIPWPKAIWRGKGWFGVYILGYSPLREAKAVIWRQELNQKSRRNATYWLAFCGLFRLLYYTTQDTLHRGGHCPPEGWVLPCGIIGQENILQGCL